MLTKEHPNEYDYFDDNQRFSLIPHHQRGLRIAAIHQLLQLLPFSQYYTLYYSIQMLEIQGRSPLNAHNTLNQAASFWSSILFLSKHK